MSNTSASKIKEKYVKKSSNTFIDTRKMRGLQAEINKIESIIKVVLDERIDVKEIIRLKNRINKLTSIINSKLTKF